MNSTIGISTWSLQHTSYTRGMDIYEMIDVIAGMGVDGLDLYNEYIPCYPALNLHELNRILDRCRANNLPITTTWFMADIVSGCLAASEDAFLEEMKNYLAITAACGCDLLTLPMLFNVPGLTHDDHFACMMRFFEKAVPVAERYNVRFAHELPRQGTPDMGIRLAKALDNRFYTLCPDLEAWRLETEDIPLVHAEMGPGEVCVPETVEIFRECLKYSASVHFKLLALDEKGEEPHFPIPELMQAINEIPNKLHLALEYEGWIPDLYPERDCIEENRRCVELIRKYQK